jgi:hypothetical protein
MRKEKAIAVELKIKTLDGIEIGLQEYNDNELKELINELRSQHINAGSMCGNLDEELITQNGISLPTLIQISKWCDSHTGDYYVKGESIANEISKLLFNTILPRLKPK